MDQLTAMRVFRQVAELESFSAAAGKLNLSSGAVSKQVSALENHLGVQLLTRTTRRVSLTDSGRSYLERCARILDDIEEAELSLSQLHATPRGTLRVNAPVSFSILHLGRLFPDFLKRYPEIRLELSVNDRFVDPVEEGLDVVLRIIRELPDSSLVARRLAAIDLAVCAAPAYLEWAGTPRVPEDLLRHECLIYAQRTSTVEWAFEGPTGMHRLRVSGRYQANNSMMLRDALLDGLGICLLPTFYVYDQLRTGRLVRVLQRYKTEEGTLFAVYPRSRHLSQKVRVFVDFMSSSFAPGRVPWEPSQRHPPASRMQQGVR